MKTQLAIRTPTTGKPRSASRRRSATLTQDAPAVQRKTCACGGTCPRCRNSASPAGLPVSQPHDSAEQEADRVAERILRMPQSSAPRPTDPGRGQEPVSVRRKPGGDAAAPTVGAGFAARLGPGTALAPSVREFFEPRFGHDFRDVRVHAGAAAAESARSIAADAYTVGRDIVFGAGRYAPRTPEGRKLLAHELAHVVQQRSGFVKQAQRTPARQVSCAPGPLHLPGPPPMDIADPVDVITQAENTANGLLDDLIAELDFTRARIVAGEPAAWPTISDALASSVRLMGLDPDDRAIWTAPTGTGQRSVTLLLRRLRLIRGTIGAGSFFFTCLGPDNGAVGHCVGPICAGGNVVVSCPGEFRMVFCEPFWRNTPEDQAARIVHESAHNFADFVGHQGRFVNAECFARAVQMFGGVDEGLQRTDLCPNP